MCCSDSGHYESEINGRCFVCDEPTVDGEAYEKCSYSPCQCEECGYAPCDGSC